MQWFTLICNWIIVTTYIDPNVVIRGKSFITCPCLDGVYRLEGLYFYFAEILIKYAVVDFRITLMNVTVRMLHTAKAV